MFKMIGNAGTSSMVAAICYAWLLENRMRRGSCKGKGDNREAYAVVPVMNVKRERMWKQKQAAWLFYHVGLEVNSLLFADEVRFSPLITFFGFISVRCRSRCTKNGFL